MEVQRLINEARAGKFKPVHLIVGAEHFLAERAVKALRRAVTGGASDPLNQEVFFGKADAGRIVEAARTLPMLAQMRFILVRGADQLGEAGLERLADYLEAPVSTTCLVAVAEKLDGRSRIARLAKERGYWVDVSPLKPSELRGFANAGAEARGHRLEPDAAAALLDAVGNDLDALDDALERLSLFVGANQPVDQDAVLTCVSRVRVDSIWALVDAVGMRDPRAALRASASLLADGEPPLRILSLIARQIRMVARTRQALASGLSAQEAAKIAGAPPFKARDLAASAQRFSDADLGRAFRVLADTDLALKGSRRPPDTILQGAILELARR